MSAKPPTIPHGQLMERFDPEPWSRLLEDEADELEHAGNERGARALRAYAAWAPQFAASLPERRKPWWRRILTPR